MPIEKIERAKLIQILDQNVYDVNNVFNTIGLILNNYEQRVKKLSKSDLLYIARKVFLKNNRPTFNASVFALNRNLTPKIFISWLTERFDSNVIHPMIRDFMKNGIIGANALSTNFANLSISFINNDEIRKQYSTFFYIDGDNLQSYAIPLYKGIIQPQITGNGKIKVLSFYVYKILPSFITVFHELNKIEYPEYLNTLNIISSYDDKKDAADVGLNSASTLILDRILRDSILSNSSIITNDKFANEIVRISDSLINNYMINNSTYQWIDPVFDRRNYRKDPWHPNTNLSQYMNFTVDKFEISPIGFSSYFIRLIRLNQRIEPIPSYQYIFQLVRETESFDEMMTIINERVQDIEKRIDLTSQYFVLSGSRYFSLSELSRYFLTHINYLKNSRNQGIELLYGEYLQQFLNLEINPLFFYVYPGIDISDLILNYLDFRTIFRIQSFEHEGRIVTKLLI